MCDVKNINVPQLFGFSCSFYFDFVDYLLFMTVGPAAVVVAVIGITCLRVVILCKGKLGSVSMDERREIAKYRNQAFFTIVFLSYLILPGVSTTIFRMFPCANVDPESVADGPDLYMTADYSISCSSERYVFGVSWAVAMIFVYPIGKQSCVCVCV